MGEKTKNRIRVASRILFVLYILFLTYLVFLAEKYGRRDFSMRTYQYNLAPFREIQRFWRYRKILGYDSVMLNLVGNVAAFLPFGFFLPVLSSRFRNGWLSGCLGLSFSFFIECVQLVLKVGCFDVDDIILNTLGCVLGFGLFVLCDRIRRWMNEKTVSVFFYKKG